MRGMALAVAVLFPVTAAAQGGGGETAAVTARPRIEFTREFLQDPQVVALGADVWKRRCTFCHGRQAYPGKAPRLRPSRYQPQFVYDRVTFGFRAMPSFAHEFGERERRAVVAWVLSPEFAP